VVAYDGRMALAEIGQHSFAAIICDLRMPSLGGIGVYTVLQELFPEIAARIVFVTAYRQDPQLQAFFESTGRPVLDKPVEIADLVNAVTRVIASQAEKSE
jgi:CheY-like chemotaxis protein